MGTEILDNVESVNIPKLIPEYAQEPFHPFFESFREEIADFSRVRLFDSIASSSLSMTIIAVS